LWNNAFLSPLFAPKYHPSGKFTCELKVVEQSNLLYLRMLNKITLHYVRLIYMIPGTTRQSGKKK
jgi:hypothetical protein